VHQGVALKHGKKIETISESLEFNKTIIPLALCWTLGDYNHETLRNAPR